MKFKFSLQSVLDVRCSLVESLEVQLGQMMRERMKVVELLEELNKTLHTLFMALQREKLLEDMDLFTISRLHENIEYTQEAIKAAKEELKVIEAKIERKRKELLQAKQDVEVMEILKDKEYQRLLKEELARESRDLDDIYIARAFRMMEHQELN